jgi:hypothetical protein
MWKFVSSTVAALALGCGLAPSPEPEPEPNWQRHELRGEVLQLRTGDVQAAVIKHEEIVDYMDAMTMAFPVRDDIEFAKLSKGVHITAAVMANGYSELYIEDIEIIEAPAEEGASEVQ